jgi:nucleotide-binding universal stress UspA family protein
MNNERIIVVGVDGGPRGDAALRFAIDEAQRTGDGIEAITSWPLEPLGVDLHHVVTATHDPDTLQQDATARQEASIRRIFGGPPTVPIASRVLRGDAGPVLVEASRHARLLVVGARGHGVVAAAFLGSASRYCAQHATCPVVIVPAGPGDAPAPEGLAVNQSSR